MYKILINSFTDNPTLYFVSKGDLEKYLPSEDIKSSLKAKDWIYNNPDIIRKLAKKRIKVDLVS